MRLFPISNTNRNKRNLGMTGFAFEWLQIIIRFEFLGIPLKIRSVVTCTSFLFSRFLVIRNFSYSYKVRLSDPNKNGVQTHVLVRHIKSLYWIQAISKFLKHNVKPNEN